MRLSGDAEGAATQFQAASTGITAVEVPPGLAEFVDMARIATGPRDRPGERARLRVFFDEQSDNLALAMLDAIDARSAPP